MLKYKNKLHKYKSEDGILDKIIKYKSLLGMLSGFFIASGAILVFIYYFFYINYIPSELNIGDSLSYIFISLGFGLMYFVFIFLHLYCVFCFVHKWLLGGHEKIIYFFGVITLCLVVIFDYFFIGFDFRFVFLIFMYILIILLVFYTYMIERFKNGPLYIFSLFLLLFFPLCINGVLNLFLDKSLSNLGVKVYDASIKLSDEEFLSIRKIANEQGVTLKTSCNIFDKNKLIHDVNILWSIGKESLIEISGESNEGNRRIRLTVNNDNMKPIKISSPRKCIFKEFRNIKYDEFNKIKDFISTYRQDEISKVEFYIFLESESYNGMKNKNLSEVWSDSILESLPLNIQSDILSFKYLEKLEYAQYCRENILGSYELQDCNSINKGIILELELKNKVLKNNQLEKGWFKFERLFNSIWF